MRLVESLPEIERNIEVLAKYLAHPGTPEGEFAQNLIAHGICFVATTREAAPFFAPSRFIGYTENSRTSHISNPDKDGRDTNPAISKILGAQPAPSAELESMYLQFCGRIGIEKKSTGSFGIRRKFWNRL